MTIIFIDGFDLYSATVPETSRGWGRSATSRQTGRFGGQAARIANGGGSGIFGQTFAANSQVVVGFAMNCISSQYGDAKNVFELRHAGGLCAGIHVNTGGIIRIKNAANTVVHTTAAVMPLSGAGFVHLELAVLRHASAGTIDLYVDGVQVAALTGQNTGSANIDNAQIPELQAFGGTVDIDDFHLITGSITPLGDCRIETLRPSADTADKDWARSTGADNFALVDETTSNGDTDYVSSATATDKDIYACADLSSSPATIHAVSPTIIARKDDATARTIAGRVKSSASVGGATHTMGSAYQGFGAPVELDPNGSIAWATAAVNAAQLEIEVIT